MLIRLSIGCLLFMHLLPGMADAQCPDAHTLWQRLEQFRTYTDNPPAAQIKELLPVIDQLKKCHREYDSTYVFLLQRLGMAYHKQADEINGVRYTVASITAARNHATTGKIKPDQLMRSFYNLQFMYDSLRLDQERNNALDSFINHALRNNFYAAPLYFAIDNRVRYCYYAGDYQRCLSYAGITELLPASRDSMIVNALEQIRTNQFQALLALQQYDSVERMVTRQLVIAEKDKDAYHLASLYGIAANVERGRGRYDKALALFRKGYDNYHIAHYDKGCAVVLNAIGFLYFEKLHDPVSALRHYKQALPFADPTEAVSIYDNIANIYVLQGADDSAIDNFRKAFDQIAPGQDESGLLKTSISHTVDNISEYVMTLLLDKGDFFLSRYSRSSSQTWLHQAIVVYRAADQLLNRLKIEQADIVSRLFWRVNTRRLYEHAIQAAWLGQDAASAFYFFEKSRAVLLNDQLTRQHWSDNAVILEQAQLKKSINTLQNILNDPATGPQQALRAKAELFTRQQALSTLDQRFGARNPLYFQQFTDSSSIGLNEAQAHLGKEGQSLVELYAGDSAVYSMIVTPAFCQIHRLDKRAFDSAKALYSTYLSDPERLNRDMRGYILIANRLYNMIFPGGICPKGRILISPDGGYFPFESLVTSIPSDRNTDIPWFLLDHPTCYTYSARYQWQTIPDDKTMNGDDFMGMAPVRYARYLNLPDLPGSNKSLDEISSYFGTTDNVTTALASKRYFLEHFARYRLIQLYTHAIGDSPGKQPTIYFADSALSLSELIAEARPLTRLIVLSACETANGKFYQGEGVFSFNREFAALGIPSAVVNCWSVDNHATYRLTELFYKYLAAGDSTDIALQKAKLEFLHNAPADQRLPYYWAAPVLTGRSAVIVGPSHGRGWLILLLCILAVFLGAWGLRSLGNKFHKQPASKA